MGKQTRSYTAGGSVIVTIGVESNLAVSIKVTNASDLAIPHLGIYPTNMLIYSNEIHKGLFIVCNSKR